MSGQTAQILDISRLWLVSIAAYSTQERIASRFSRNLRRIEAATAGFANHEGTLFRQTRGMIFCNSCNEKWPDKILALVQWYCI